MKYEYILDSNGDIRISNNRMGRGEGFSMEGFAMLSKSEKGAALGSSNSTNVTTQPLPLLQPQEQQKKPSFFGRIFGKG